MVKRSLDFDKPVKHPKPTDAQKLATLKESLAVLEQIAEAHNENAMPDEKSPIRAIFREDVEQWIKKEVDKGRFRNRSHAIEYALLHLMKEEKKKPNSGSFSS